MPLEDSSVCVYSPSCSSVGTQCSPAPLYENVHHFGQLIDTFPSDGVTTCSTRDTSSAQSSVKNDSVTSSKSLDGGRKIAYNTIDSKRSTYARRTIDARPLSIPRFEYRRDRGRTERRCCVCLAFATVVVFGAAFAIWLLYDSIEKFLMQLIN
ncbi:unnamed protein product [Toxocara canis]|uniref:LEM domain-containing protein n=1 Tax=Toxocara canis TaxID=6265 RepID=A0A183UXZ2_TOXCA|nr:unnamed protein product [Toxocara canis]